MLKKVQQRRPLMLCRRIFLPLSLFALLVLAWATPGLATSFHEEDLVCGNCGQASSQRILNGFYFPFPPDMDLQPIQLILRGLDLKECPHCGYLAADFSTPPSQAAKAAFASRAYADIAALNIPEQARRFLRAALLEEAEGNYLAAGLNMSDAAWLCGVSEERWEAEMQRWEPADRENGEWLKRPWADIDLEDLPKPIDFPPLPPEVSPEAAAREAEYRDRAIDLLEKAVELKQLGSETRFFVPYLLAELNRRAGDFEQARHFIAQSRALFAAEPGDLSEAYSLLLDREEEFIANKDSSRQSTIPIFNKMK